MSTLVLDVELRERTGTGGARETRRAGQVPGILYGGEKGPVPIAVSSKELRKAIAQGGIRSSMLKIAHKGEQQSVLVRDIQFDPVTDVPVHFDLYRVEAGQVISVEVPVHFLNEGLSPGIKRGGALNIVRHTVELDVPADSIPDHLEVDLTGLDIGASIHISALKLPAGASPTIKDRDFTIATIAGAGGESTDEEAPTPETEVIKKGKAEGEG